MSRSSSRRLSSRTAEAASAPTQATDFYSAKSAPAKPRKKKSAGKSKGRAQELAQQDDMPDPEEVSFDGPGFDPTSNRLYCVCLGSDDGSPMLQCEGCNNWFHFRCIDLTPAAALNIQSYFCEICTEVGAGVTQLKPPRRAQQVEAPASSSDEEDDEAYGTDPEYNNGPEGNDPGSEEEEAEGAAPDLAEASFDQKAVPGSGSHKRKLVSNTPASASTSAQNSRRKKRQKAEGLSSDEDSDNEEDLDWDEMVGGPKKRAPPKSQAKVSKPAPVRASSSSTNVKPPKKEAPPTKANQAALATRKQCTGTLSKALQPVFAPSAGGADKAQVKAEEFAQELESGVFEQFSEPPDNQPKTKYLAKIRQLLFNLKTSELLRTGVALGHIPASRLVNLSMDELLTPEQRALADNVRAKSLKDSVKQDVDTTQPRIRTTHKGQELIGEDQSSSRSFHQASGQAGSPPRSPDKASLDIVDRRSHSREGSSAQSPATAESPQATGHERRRSSMGKIGNNVALSPKDLGMDANEQEDEAMEESAGNTPASGSPAPGTSSSKPAAAKFDFDSVWGSLQSPPPTKSPSAAQHDGIGSHGPQSPMDTDVQHVKDDDEYDPFDFGGADDMPASTTPPMSPAPAGAAPSATPVTKAPAPDPCEVIPNFSQVWAGDFFMPEEGGFPARAVQVGGRPLGDAPLVWQSILASKMTVEGRLPTKTATDYLVQCSFAPSREIVVLAILPDVNNPNMPADQCRAKQQSFIDMFTRRDRNGVVPPASHRRQLVKDCYVVPLRAAEEALPEYIELLDEHALGDKGERKSDLLIAVLVLQKGLVPSSSTNQAPRQAPPPALSQAPDHQSQPPATTSAALPSQSTSDAIASTLAALQPPTSQIAPPAAVSGYGSPFPGGPGQGLPSFSAPPPSTAPAFDPSALQSLVSQPNLLASLVASANQNNASTSASAPGPPAPPAGMPMPPPAASQFGASFDPGPPMGYPGYDQGPPYGSHQPRPDDYPPQDSYAPYNRGPPMPRGDRSPPRRSGRDGPPPFRGRGGGPPRGPRGGWQNRGRGGPGRGGAPRGGRF